MLNAKMSSYPVLSDKAVNNKTRVDISVSSYKEIEGPLGGISVEYVVFLVAEQKALDPDCTTNVIVEYKTLKSYRECEDFYVKLRNKHSAVQFPALPKTYSHICTPPENRLEALDKVMKFISSTSPVCSSPQLLSFLGIEFTGNAQLASNPTGQDHNLDDNKIFKKVKIKSKNVQGGADNNNGSSEVILGNETSETLDDDFDEMFKEPVVRKRNETGSKPLFDELSLLKRSEELNQRELLLFDPNDYGGPASNAEEDLFLIPEAKKSVDAADGIMDDTEDTLELLSVHDDLDQFLAKVNKPYSTTTSTSDKSSNVGKSSAQALPSKRPVPPPKPTVPLKPSSIPVPPESAKNPKVQTSERLAAHSKPVPAARNRGAHPVPQPRKHVESTSNANVEKAAEKNACIESVDILKYIEDEQKNAVAEPDLFS